jgi:transposase InsO family protein
VQIDFSRPGKPTDNAHVESLNGALRAECLDAHESRGQADHRSVVAGIQRESRPHRAHGKRTPLEIAKEFAANREFLETQTTGDSLCA